MNKSLLYTLVYSWKPCHYTFHEETFKKVWLALEFEKVLNVEAKHKVQL